MIDQKMPLAMACPGESLKVMDIRAGKGLTQRLADMGLTPGTRLKLVHSPGAGPTLIDLRGSRLVLGAGVAQKIMVADTGD